MRCSLLVIILSCCLAAAAQTAVKTIPGVLKQNPYGMDLRSGKAFHFAASQKTVAMMGNWDTYIVLDPLKGTYTTIGGGMHGISPDHRYVYRTDIYTDTATKEKKALIITKGVFTDTATRRIKMPAMVTALGMDDRNNLIVTKFITDQNKTTHRIGLYKVDRVTGKELETLRTDTFCRYSDRWDGCKEFEINVEKNYALWSESRPRSTVKILPFGKRDVIEVYSQFGFANSTDSSIFYAHLNKGKDYQLKAYEVSTGKLAGQKIYPWTVGLHKFFFTQGKIYFYNSNEGILYEDEPAGDTIRTLRSWDMRSLLNLSPGQEWNFAVSPGPSFLFYPIWMDKAEAGGAAANTASLFDPAANKTTLQIAPFFNRTYEEAATAAALKKASDERFAASQKEKAAKDPCNIGWNVPGYKEGVARMYDGVRYILKSFDCKTDLYTVVRPPDLTKGTWETKYETSTRFGKAFREISTLSDKQYHICTACGGDGSTLVTRYTTTTKELPWGYFSGIETKRIKTTATQSKETCKVCRGFGILLK